MALLQLKVAVDRPWLDIVPSANTFLVSLGIRAIYG